MYCSYCGAKNPDEHRFCGMCGELMVRPAAPEGNRRPVQREAPPANVTVMPREVQRPVPLAEVLAEKEAAEKRRQEREAERYIGQPARTIAPPPPPPPRNDLPPAHLGGPSFLGLSDPARAEGSNADYLLEDEDYRPRRSYGRFMLLLLILAVFAGLGYLQWRKSQGQPFSPLAEQVEAPAGGSADAEPSPAAADANTPQTPAEAAAEQPQSQTPPANPEAAQGPAQSGSSPEREPSSAATEPKQDDDGARADEDDERQEPEPEPKASATPPEPEKPAATQREQADAEIDSAAGDRELELGRAYLSGRYGGRDASEAAKWLWRAVSKGNTDASLALADLYLAGEGVEKNCDQARVLLTAAARKGNSDAASKLRTLDCGA